MTGTGPSLPDTFEIRQARELGEELDRAVAANEDEPDFSRAVKIANHIAAEASTSPEERAFLSDSLLATTFFKLAIKAKDLGNEARGERFLGAMAQMCSRRACDIAVLGGLLQAGLKEGELPAAHYDRLKAAVDTMGPEVRAMFGPIKRLDS